jgi:hypothetical protein
MKKRQYDRPKVQIFKKPENTGIASLALILAKLINKVKKYRLGIIKLKNYLMIIKTMYVFLNKLGILTLFVILKKCRQQKQNP